jgi:hypothetical protein
LLAGQHVLIRKPGKLATKHQGQSNCGRSWL